MEGIPFSFEIKRDLSILGVVFIFLESLVIDLITKQLAQTFNLDSKTGLFFSAFDQEGKLLASHGVIKTDRTLNTLLQSLYLGILKQLEPQIKSIIFDVVEDLKLQNDPHLLAHLPLQEYGLFLVE